MVDLSAGLTGYDFVILHYAEIGLKGGNRLHFEKRLMENTKLKLGANMRRWQRETGQLTIELTENANHAAVGEALNKIPGIANFSFAKRLNWDLDEIAAAVVVFAKTQNFATFKIDTRRHEKNYPLNSVGVNEVLGRAVGEALPEACVRLTNPDLTIKIEITSGYAYVSGNALPGVGGLPTNGKQKVVVLLSGGMDSPVAASMMMKRGCQVSLVHFQNQNQMAEAVKDKILRLAEQLAKFQTHTELRIVPFGPLQKEIVMHVKAEQRMLIYRRLMLRLATRLAEEKRARFLVTGDSFSQVASQTYQNLHSTYLATEMRIFTPLIGLDKKEIIAIAQRIGTYEISALPYGDCCSYFLPKHPELRGRILDLERFESKMDLTDLENTALAEAQLTVWE